MIKEGIDKILDLAKIEQFEIDGRKYTSKGIVPVKEPSPAALIVHTLSGIVDYLTTNFDKLKTENLAIHVKSPIEVSLYGSLISDSFYERFEFLRAEFEPSSIQSTQYVSLENFIIGLQAYFVPTDTTTAILKVVGNIKDERVNQFSDDGKTQSVTAKSGIAVVESVQVPNPVTLRPFRTFPEVEQPGSLFVFRVKSTRGEAPLCGLWEADNKLWKVEAIKNIAAWLSERVKGIPIIA